jgi:peptidoglycan pentaglycine glycine transferase (the first glycine)
MERNCRCYSSADAPDVVNRQTWDAFVAGHPAGHLLQTWAWGELKARFGWRALRLAWVAAGGIVTGAQVLFRPVLPGLSLAYVPKGPLVDWADVAQAGALLDGLCAVCRTRRSIFLKIEPHAPDGAALREAAVRHGALVSEYSVQPPRTIVVDLRPAEEDILAAMKQKTRYNVRLAARKGVTVHPGTLGDLPTFHRLSQITGQRDGFGVHSLEYFRAAFELFAADCALLLAEVEGQPVAGVMVFAHGSTAYYLFGASSDAHREKMPAYLLQWEAMRWARERGCRRYDLWGIPDADEATLEANFTAHGEESAGLWGVYRFKRGFGGQVVRAVGAFDFAFNRPLYWAYRRWTARRRGGGWA